MAGAEHVLIEMNTDELLSTGRSKRPGRSRATLTQTTATSPSPETLGASLQNLRMRIGALILGILSGSVLMYLFLKQPWANETMSTRTNVISEWIWPDSLDALIAAPDNHKLIYEDSTMRVLSVTVVPGILDPIHTHKGRSIVWVTKASPILYKTYDYGENHSFKLVKTDTINVKPGELNKATWEKPEPPHSVENIGKDTFHLYRIEYKK